MEKTWFYEILFFQEVIVMAKDKKSCAITNTMSNQKLVLYITGIIYIDKTQEYSYQ